MAAIRSKEFVLPVENKAGTLADIASVLADKQINITAFLCESRGEYGILRMVTDQPEATAATLRDAHQTFRMNDVVSVRVPDRPGELARLAQLLAAGGVNLSAAYASSASDGGTLLTFVPDDVHSAQKVLAQLR